MPTKHKRILVVDRPWYLNSLYNGVIILQIVIASMIVYDQGFDVVLNVPFNAVELGVALLMFLRYSCSFVRDEIYNNRKSGKGLKYCVTCINYPGAYVAEIFYFLSFSCVVFRVLTFHESNNCLIDTCTITDIQKYMSLVAGIILWSIAEEKKGRLVKPKQTQKSIPVVVTKSVDYSNITLDLSGTNYFRKRRATGKLRLV